MPDTRARPKTLVRKELNRLRARGPAEVMSLALARIRENMWSEEVLIFFARATAADETPPDEGLRLIRATAADGPRYARDIGTDSASTFAERLTDGTRCYLVERRGTIVHASWTTTTGAWTRELRRYFAPPPGHAYTYESFTRPEARGLGAYPFALRAIAAELGKEGTERLWVGVEEHNSPSIKAVTKGGFEEAFRVFYRRRLGILFVDRIAGPAAATGAAALRKRLDEEVTETG